MCTYKIYTSDTLFRNVGLKTYQKTNKGSLFTDIHFKDPVSHTFENYV